MAPKVVGLDRDPVLGAAAVGLMAATTLAMAGAPRTQGTFGAGVVVYGVTLGRGARVPVGISGPES